MFAYKTSLKQKLLIFVLLTITAVIAPLYADMRLQQYPRNLNAALDYYGFRTLEQKQALRYLMQKAGVKNVDSLLVREAKSTDELTRTILALVRETQDKFTIRTGKQERWDVQTSEWMKDPKQQDEIIAALKTLKIMDAVPPTFKKRDAICVLGAHKFGIFSRLKYAEKLFVANKFSANWLIMLAGERYVTPDKNGTQLDGNEQELAALAAKLNKDIFNLTETDLMKAAYQASTLYGHFPDREVFIDTPRRGLPRPTTETTVTELCEWLKKHPKVYQITFISNQPHVEYQRAVIAQVFEKQGVKIKFEAIGPEFNAEKFNNSADKINYIMQALGSTIWAKTPGVLNAIGIDISNPEYMELYKKQPLIYNNIKEKLSMAFCSSQLV